MNILLTSVGRRSYLAEYFKAALGSGGEVHVSNSTDVSPAFMFADRCVVTPLIYDKEYIPFLLNYCRENKIDGVIPLFDINVPVLSRHKESFEKNGTRVIAADAETAAVCNDKYRAYKWLKERGFDVPKTYLSAEEFNEDIKNKAVSYPAIVKPRWGMGSLGVYRADNEEELKVFHNKALSQIKETYLKYESAADISSAVIIQEMLTGREYGLDIINDLNGRHINTVVKEKRAMRSGETDCAVTVNNIELKKLGARLAAQTKHCADMDADVFESEGRYYILDMNARFGGGYPFSHAAGKDLPKAIVSWLGGGDGAAFVRGERFSVLSHKDIRIVRLSKGADK
ncbi:MAG TPA: ATP-grasp domain-containing protein [Candidatus Ornithomonoglobus intestinigallinarum]|uniref:ATP-grasp domain-containing protein n=1 Tax=Candidatus Ornithomonoglobus intestinigallinarum TaxID=2840894 RepID=A0A9D1KNA6_9FIRM|nr:ATP-grasp domain-containing protein [Candidatus Ornithomonoglobus intestinigallinarum]